MVIISTLDPLRSSLRTEALAVPNRSLRACRRGQAVVSSPPPPHFSLLIYFMQDATVSVRFLHPWPRTGVQPLSVGSARSPIESIAYPAYRLFSVPGRNYIEDSSVRMHAREGCVMRPQTRQTAPGGLFSFGTSVSVQSRTFPRNYTYTLPC
ncbi:hypothetical protein BO71DRAFT_54863 [Aspergillus ellipticus CBS 707.79]|uniref:Uncharacterized protein n=1 Tax=Aspergillus ellipticus CBS 707.79 TaxID=1448320 RepID=A0A319D1X8_9EURO|nr:hypothetical protein BO71DRAFT_54863 [Aspergillus ellipticus CBS 707.79]